MASITDVTLPASGASWLTWGQGVDADLRPRATAVKQVDSFTGTDAQKMQAALDFVQAEIAAGRIAPWIQLPPRTFNTGSSTFQMFTGCKIAGSGVDFGGKNLEHTPGTGKWQTSCGSGASSLLQSTTTVYNTNVTGVAFHGTTSTSQIFRSTVNSYTCHFNNLTFYGVKHAFGNTAGEKWLGTQVTFAGHWTCLTYSDTPFVLGGGDMSLWMTGYLNSNSPPSIAGAGKPIVHLSGVGKTDIGFMYLTNENDWEGLRIEGGSMDKAVTVYGGVYEGQSPTNVATRPCINMISGQAILVSPQLGQVSGSSGNVSGVIHQSGGRLVIKDAKYLRASGTSAAFPLLYQTGGTASVSNPVCCYTTGEQIRIRWSSGITQTAELPGNSLRQDSGYALASSLIKSGAIVANDFAGYCQIGSVATDTTNGKLYICTATNGTSTSTWQVVGAQT